MALYGEFSNKHSIPFNSLGDSDDVRIMLHRKFLQAHVLQAHGQGQRRQGFQPGGDGVVHDQPGIIQSFSLKHYLLTKYNFDCRQTNSIYLVPSTYVVCHIKGSDCLTSL